MPSISVSKAVASVGTEIINTRVEIPAMEIPITELTRVILRSLSFDSVWFCRFNVVSLSPYSDFYVEILDSGVSAADVTVLNADPTRTGLAELPRSDEIARSRRVSSCY